MRKILYTSLIITFLAIPHIAQPQNCYCTWVANYRDKNIDSETFAIFCVSVDHQLYLCDGGGCETRRWAPLCWYVDLLSIAFLHYQQQDGTTYNGVLFPVLGIGFGTYHGLFRIPGVLPILDIYLPYRTPIFFEG